MITTLTISGMTCNGCVRHVDKALRGTPGVSAVQVDLANQRATVEHADGTTPEALLAAVTEAGYEAAPA